MVIEVNGSKQIEITEDNLVIKNGRLFNNVTKQYEGIDGDRVTFLSLISPNSKCLTSGTVDGYTCGQRVKLSGVDVPYEAIEGSTKEIEHISTITNTECVDKEDWEAALI